MSQAAAQYPQQMGDIILQAMHEVIGSAGVEKILAAASLPQWPAADMPFQSLSAMLAGMEQAYGVRAGRGLALRVGRACFSYGLREYGSRLGFTQAAFRLLPLRTKLHSGARIFAELFNKHTDQRVRVESDQEQMLWHIERCPLCWERRADEPVCHMAVGLLQESLYWVSGGKIFNVEETSCIARGDAACTVTVGLSPIS